MTGDGAAAAPLRARVSVEFKPGVLDPEAAAIERALRGLGFSGVSGVRRRKVIELDLAAADRGEAEAQLRAMADGLLANPVIETYAVEVVAG